MKYKTAMFAGYALLPNALPTSNVFHSLTLGLIINLETDIIEDVSATVVLRIAADILHDYFVGKNVVLDYDQIVEEITFRHQGNACKGFIKAFGEIHRKYIDFKHIHN